MHADVGILLTFKGSLQLPSSRQRDYTVACADI